MTETVDKLTRPALIVIVVKLSIHVEKILMAASCVCQSRSAVANACHEQDLYGLKSGSIKDEEWKEASGDNAKMTKIVIIQLLVALHVMIGPAEAT